MLQALNLSDTIGEHQIRNLMQVILSGLKTGVHKEFRACSIILFGCVVPLPRVKLNEKVTSKFLKTISKMQPKSTETLSMTALLFRCQIHSLDNTERILNEIINHENILKEEVFTNVSKQVDEDQEFSRRILKCLALLCDKTLNNGNASHEILCLLKIVQHGLGECLPTSDTAEIFIACISQALVHFKSQKKQNKDMAEEELSCLKSVCSTCTKILDILRTSFVEEYSKKSHIRPENDIVFVDGYENPSEEIVVAHRTLMENDFIRNFTEKLMGDCNTLEKDILQSNYNPLLKVLLAPNEFLIRQLKHEGTVNLLVNALKSYSHKPKLIGIGLKKLKTLMALANTEFKDYVDKLFLRTELLFLPNLFLRGGQNEFDEMYEIFQELSSDGTQELLVFLKPTVEVAKKEELKPSELTRLLIEKLCSMDEKKLVDLSKTIQSSCLYDEAVLYSLLIHILTKTTSTIDSNSPTNCSSPSHSQLYMELISSILNATKKFKVKMKKNKHIHKYLITSKDKNVISSRIFDESIQTLIQKGDDHKVLLSMLASIWQIRSVNPTLVQKLVEGLRALRGSIEFSSALLCMPIKDIFQYFGEDKLNDEASISKQMHLQATDHILGELRKICTLMVFFSRVK